MRNELFRYLELLKALAAIGEPLGDCRKGEIQIVDDPQKIGEIERAVAGRLAAQGHPAEYAKVGILAEDQYALYVRDAVLFPPKTPGGEPAAGTYIRYIYRNTLNGNPGISILPFTADGRVVLNRAYRHALRRRTVEAPGTIAKDGETAVDAVKRCMAFELGAAVPDAAIRLLTPHYAPDRGLIGGTVPIYAVELSMAPGQAEDPTVMGHVVVDGASALDALKEGVIDVGGVPHHFCDGYTIAGLLFAGLRGLILL